MRETESLLVMLQSRFRILMSQSNTPSSSSTITISCRQLLLPCFLLLFTHPQTPTVDNITFSELSPFLFIFIFNMSALQAFFSQQQK